MNGPFTAPPLKSAPDDELALRRNQNAAWFGGTDGTSNTVPSLPFATPPPSPVPPPPHLFFVHSAATEQLLVIKGTSERRVIAESEEEERVWRDERDKGDTSRLQPQTKLMSC